MSGHTDSQSQTVMFMHQIVFKVLCKISGPWKVGHSDLRLFSGQIDSKSRSIIQSSRYNTISHHHEILIIVTYIYFEVKCQVILTHNPKVWCSNIKHSSRYKANHWTMKYRSQWPTLIFRSNVGSYWLIILKHDVHISNSLQEIK